MNGRVEDLGPLSDALVRDGEFTPEAECFVDVLRELV
jgi:hypothetical protein